jgi:hypothetical protein
MDVQAPSGSRASARTPLGHDFRTIADALLAGRSASLPSAASTAPSTPVASPDSSNRSMSRRRESRRFQHPAAARPARPLVRGRGARQRLVERRSDVRIGVVLGLGAEWVVNWEVDGWRGDRMFRHEPDAVPLVESTARRLRLTGPVATVSSACQRQHRPRTGGGGCGWAGRTCAWRERVTGVTAGPGGIRQPARPSHARDEPEKHLGRSTAVAMASCCPRAGWFRARARGHGSSRGTARAGWPAAALQ